MNLNYMNTGLWVWPKINTESSCLKRTLWLIEKRKFAHCLFKCVRLWIAFHLVCLPVRGVVANKLLQFLNCKNKMTRYTTHSFQWLMLSLNDRDSSCGLLSCKVTKTLLWDVTFFLFLDIFFYSFNFSLSYHCNFRS